MSPAITPTPEQQAVIDYGESLVVVARPGSGKTFVLSEKIRSLLPEIQRHQGIIAISYTNKASDELKRRTKHDGIDVKASFFGTIDRFCDNEIIIPFLSHLWGSPGEDITIVRIRDLPEDEQEQFAEIEEKENQVSLEDLEEHLGAVRSYYLNGQLLLETNGALALYVLRNSAACRSYLEARYTHVFIDEYQDSGLEQHELFLELQGLGLIAVAVGDADQSIFGFSGKSSEHLVSLAGNDGFLSFPVTYNHRCHPSIINYSLRLLDPDAVLLETDEARVYLAEVRGTAENIAAWIDAEIQQVCEMFDVGDYSSIGILTRSSRTGSIVDETLLTPHRFFSATALEEDFSLWGKLFARLLTYHYDDRLTAQEIVDEFGSHLLTPAEVRACRKSIKGLNVPELPGTETFQAVAEMLLPNAEAERAVELLQETLDTPDLLRCFQPASDDEIQIMTLHKAKGMEFDVVFHLDLYEWVLPMKGPGPNNDWNNPSYRCWKQDVNLHYVGVTRARKCCVLFLSTQRINSAGELKQGSPSEFLSLNDIDEIRGDIGDIL